MDGDDILTAAGDGELTSGATSEAALAMSKDNNNGDATEIDHASNPLNPWNWNANRKWFMLALSCFVTFIVGINATALTAAVSETNPYFGISDDDFPNSVWPVTAWNTGAAIAPMLVLPLLEEHGIRLGYITIYLLFLIFVVPQAVAKNLSTLLVTRFLAGCCAGVLQDSMDGIIADLWREAEERSFPVSCYVLSLLAGVSFGPVMGGAVMESGLGWRW
jgi:MFS family permease